MIGRNIRYILKVQRYKILYENVHIKFKCNLYILLQITYEYLFDK
jgi:hypothetical protein